MPIINDYPSQAKHPATCFVQVQEVQVFELFLYKGWRVVLCTVLREPTCGRVTAGNYSSDEDD